MSQKREKEETELKVPESLPLTLPITPPPSSTPSHISDLKLSGESRSNSSASSPDRVDLKLKISSSNESRSNTATSPESTDLVVRKRLREPSRCSGMNCRKKVGLMPFRCRCGDVFCSEHRYSDRHECTYDYKAAARETIARENPVVKAAKILKV